MPLTALFRPAAGHLPQYIEALQRGWSPDNLRTEATASAHLALIAADAEAFLAAQHDPEGRGAPITRPDGTQVQRLPGWYRWIIDPAEDALCGAIGFRWQPGTSALPPHVLGHIGYAVVPWRRGRGHATRALGLLLAELRGLPGLSHVDLTTDPENPASITVIESNGGVLVEQFEKDAAYGGAAALRFRITLAPPPGITR